MWCVINEGFNVIVIELIEIGDELVKKGIMFEIVEFGQMVWFKVVVFFDVVGIWVKVVWNWIVDII